MERSLPQARITRRTPPRSTRTGRPRVAQFLAADRPDSDALTPDSVMPVLNHGHAVMIETPVTATIEMNVMTGQRDQHGLAETRS